MFKSETLKVKKEKKRKKRGKMYVFFHLCSNVIFFIENLSKNIPIYNIVFIDCIVYHLNL